MGCRNLPAARWPLVRIENLLLLGLLLLSSGALADANDGEYLGFVLGEKFTVPRGAISMDHITGAMVYVVDPGQQPHHIDSVSIYVSPKSMIVGSIFGEWYFPSKRAAESFAERYMGSLQSRYSNWKRRRQSLTYGDYQLWVEVEEKPPIVDFWPSHLNVRVGIGLIYAPDSVGRSEWVALIHGEVNDLHLSAKK